MQKLSGTINDIKVILILATAHCAVHYENKSQKTKMRLQKKSLSYVMKK